MNRVLHYSGGVVYRSRGGIVEMLPGWAACVSGQRAYAIADSGMQTRDRAAVTCKRCRDLIARDAALAAAPASGGGS